MLLVGTVGRWSHRGNSRQARPLEAAPTFGACISRDSVNNGVNNCEDIYEGEVLFYLYDGVPNTIYNESGEISVYFDIGDENNLNFVEVGNVSTITQSGFMITPLCVDNINVVLVNVLTTPFGSTTYSWRVRNFLNTEYYDFGTFMIENDECISIEVDLK